MTPDEIERIIRQDPMCGIGLALGYRDLVGVDVDSEKAYGAVHEVIGGMHPPTKRGFKGATSFFYAPNVRSKKFLEAGSHSPLVEILALGNQSVIPDTIHPDTGLPYRWLSIETAGTLEDIIRPRDLPLLTPQHVEQLAELLAPLMPKQHREYKREPVEIRDPNLSPLMRRRYEAIARYWLRKESADLASTAKGGRKNALLDATLRLGKYVANSIISREELEKELLAACKTNGLRKENSESDLLKTINYGLQQSKDNVLPELEERPY